LRLCLHSFFFLFSPIVFPFFGAYLDEGAQNGPQIHTRRKTMTKTSAVNLGSVAVCQVGRLRVNQPVRSSQLKKTVSLMMAFILSLLLVPAAEQDLNAQTPVPTYVDLNADQLDQLVAPIALDPDPLVAQILTASTYPDQVSAADSWLNQNMGLPPDQRASGADGMSWDAAVKGLTAFPAVLDNLAKNSAWTAQLGNAYYNQPGDVMNAIQAMRSQAQQSNTLVTTAQQRVVVEAGVIGIVPTDPAVVYVPYYNPWTIWGTLFASYPGYVALPPPAGIVAGVGLAFEPPVAVAAYAGFGWGFSAWAPAWTSGTVLCNHGTYISQSMSVANHGSFGGHDRGVFEHGGRGVPNGYRTCAHAGAAREAASRAGTTSVSRTSHQPQTRSSYSSKTSVQSQTRTSHSSKTTQSRTRNSSASKTNSQWQAHNSSKTGSNHSQTRNSSSSKTNGQWQAHNSSKTGSNHSRTHNSYSSSTSNRSQAHNNTRSSSTGGRSQAHNNTHSSSTGSRSQAHNNTRSSSTSNRSQAHNNARSSGTGNRSQAHNNARSSGTSNRSQARSPRSSGTDNRPQPRTAANRQSSAGHSTGGRASGGKRK